MMGAVTEAVIRVAVIPLWLTATSGWAAYAGYYYAKGVLR